MYEDELVDKSGSKASFSSQSSSSAAPAVRFWKTVAVITALIALGMAIALAVVASSNNKNNSSSSPSNSNNGSTSVVLPSQFVIGRVNITTQTTSWTCGAATMCSVLQGYGFDVTESSMAAEMGSNDVVGTYYTSMMNATLRRGLTVHASTLSSVQSVKKWLATTAGVVIVVYQAWYDVPGCTWTSPPCNLTCSQLENGWEDGHYSAIIGWNATGFLLMDPSQTAGYYGFMSYENFMCRWHDYDGATFATGTKLVRFMMGVANANRSWPANDNTNSSSSLFRESWWPSNVLFTW